MERVPLGGVALGDVGVLGVLVGELEEVRDCFAEGVAEDVEFCAGFGDGVAGVWGVM